MGKRHIRWCEKTYRRFLKEKRGQGDLAEYNPWIHTQDFPSQGKTARIKGRLTGRIHHLMSGLELDCFMWLENLPGIEDIKEQYPLPLYHTLLAAAALKIRHPEVNGYPWVMTTDFFYRRHGIWHAVQVKPEAELAKERIREKFRIEKAYWDKLGIDWQVKTEKELNPTLGHNLTWLYSGEKPEKLIPDMAQRERIMAAFAELYRDMTNDFHILLEETDRQCQLPPGGAMQIFKALVISQQIQLDLTRPVNFKDPRQTA